MRINSSVSAPTLEDVYEDSSRLTIRDGSALIDARDMHHRVLNDLLRKLQRKGIKRVDVHNVYGQRYVGTGVNSEMMITIHGTPGNDLGAFLEGPKIHVYGNAQDGCGNTMNAGQIVVHGNAGDVAGYSMRCGKIFVRDNVGYRAGIHMKEYQNIKPCMVIGGGPGDFLGEYMAGGVILVLSMNMQNRACYKPRYVGAGMHGGVIYMRGEMTELGKEAKMLDVDLSDLELIRNLVEEYCEYFDFNPHQIMSGRFMKIVPVSNRPYGTLYAY